MAVPSRLLLLPLGLVACRAPSEPLPYNAQLVDPPAAYALWWKVTEACSGISGDFAAVRWYVVPNVATIADGSDQSLGMWYAAGNRIVLAGRRAMDGRVVRHEMLHALVGPTSGEGHPNEYFVQRCGGVVDCQSACLADGPPTPAPDPLATVLEPKQVQLALDVLPSSPGASVYGGWMSVTVTATNPLEQPAWVTIPRLGPGRADGQTFAYALQDSVAGYDWTLAEAVYFTAHETRRYTFDVHVGDGALAPGGRYQLDGLFGDAQTAPVSLTIAP